MAEALYAIREETGKLLARAYSSERLETPDGDHLRNRAAHARLPIRRREAQKVKTKFFIPNADGPEQARVYDSIKEFLGFKFSGRRIQRIRWVHEGRQYQADVGQPTDFNGELVIAILFEPDRGADGLYYICTPNRGVARGGAILAGGGFVKEVIDFEV